MKPHEFTIAGRTNGQGNLLMPVSELKDFTSKHPNKRILLTLKVYEPGTSTALRGYYYGYVIKAVQEGFTEIGERLTMERTEQRLRELSPVTHRTEYDEDGNKSDYLLSISELDNAELIEHIDIIKQFAAEELSVFIEDPSTI